jgi:hypothetical protein
MTTPDTRSDRVLIVFRFISANWDLSEVTELKDRILEEDALKSRLHVVRADRPPHARL